MPLSKENSHRYSAPPRMPIWMTRSGSSTPSSTAWRNGPPWWNFGAFVFAGGVAMGIDVDHAERAVAAERLEDRQRDRMIAADGQRNDARRHDVVIAGLDIRVAVVEAEAAAHRHVADIGNRE